MTQLANGETVVGWIESNGSNGESFVAVTAEQCAKLDKIGVALDAAERLRKPDPTGAARQKRFRERKKRQESAQSTSSRALVPYQEQEPDGTVVIGRQLETKMFWNERGELVIQQVDWPDEDQCVFIAADYLDRFIDALCDRAGIPSVGKS